MAYIRQDEASIRLSVFPPGQFTAKKFPAANTDWATMTGGTLEATDVKVRPGGLKKQVSVGGPAVRADVTMTIPMSDKVAAVHNELESYCGRARAQALVAWLNPDGSRMSGASFTRVGTLKAVELPEANVDGTTMGMYTVIISCDEQAT
jgi:hypothetical protein